MHDCTKHDVPAVLIIFVIIVFSDITCFGMRLFYFFYFFITTQGVLLQAEFRRKESFKNLVT